MSPLLKGRRRKNRKANKQQRKSGFGKRLAMEGLEDRRLLAVTASLSGNNLYVYGDSADNDIAIGLKAGDSNTIEVRELGTLVDSFPAGAVNYLRAFGNDGNDTVRIDESHGTLSSVNNPYVYLYGNSGDDTLIGGESRLTRLYGDDGNDTLIGSSRNDYLVGGKGNDSYEGGLGNDILIEQAWSSLDTSITYAAGATAGDPNTIVVSDSSGTEVNTMSADIERLQLLGNNGNDTLDISSFAGSGVNNLYGNSGNDTLIGSERNDYLFGQAGNDTLQGLGGNDYLNGGKGNDSYEGGLGYDTLLEQTFSSLDTTMTYAIGATGDPNTIVVSDSSGTEVNTTSADIEHLRLWGNNGNDTLDASAFTGSGGAYLYGNNGNDTLIGSEQNDYLNGARGNDSYEGGLGYDTLIEQAWSSLDTSITYAVGATGDPDTIVVSDSSGTEVNTATADIERLQLYGNYGNDTLDASAFTGSGGAYLYGNNGNDTLIGSEQNDDLNGARGNDTLQGLGGNDYLVGGEGDDTLDGAEGNDNLYGSQGNDLLNGGGGNDRLYGQDGDDTLIVNVGQNYLNGGPEGTADNATIIATTGDDTIQVSSSYVAINNLYSYYYDIENLTVDAQGGTDTASQIGSVDVELSVINLVPLVDVDPESAFVEEGEEFTGTGSFSDLAGLSWTATVNYGDGSGEQQLTLNTDNTFNVSHTYDVQGDYVIRVNVIDDEGNVGTGMIAVTVEGNDPPTVSGPATATATEDDASFTFDLLQGASDPDTSDELHVGNLVHAGGDVSGFTAEPLNDRLLVDPSAYNHLAVGESEVIEYTYLVTDSNGGGVAQTATITITGENDTPTVVSDIVRATNEDSGLFSVDLLAAGGSSDADTSDDLSISYISQHGGLSTTGVAFSLTGSVFELDTSLFNHLAVGESVSLVFDFDITDDSGAANDTVTNRLTITLDGANDTATISGTTSRTINEDFDGVLTGVLAVSDVDDGENAFTPQTNISTAYGSFLINEIGQWKYMLNTLAVQILGNGESINDSFTVESIDGTATETVIITINGINDAPVADEDNFSTDEDVPLSGNVLANDDDREGDSLTAMLVDGPANGAVTLNPDGSFTYTPNANYHGSDGFTYLANDGDLGSNVGIVNIEVISVNDAPIVEDATLQIFENRANGALVGSVVASDPDGDNVPLGYEIVGGSGATAFEVDSASGEITVADPQQLDFETTPTFTLEVKVTDGDGASDFAVITVDLINQASISGVVFVDVNENGAYDANEPGIDGVTVELFDENGVAVLDAHGAAITAITSDGGFYLFEDLDPGDYQVHELQPTGVTDGAELLGSLVGDIVANDVMQLTLEHTDAYDYAFAEVGQQVASGDTATIGFWQNKHGQALIATSGSNLATWLTTNFGNVFGDSLDGASGEEVAEFYRAELFKKKGKKSAAGPAKVDAQFMAVALATYFTSSNLAGNSASSYGFNVTDTGIGTKVVNVGTSGAAFNVADGTDLTIMQLLLVTDSLTGQPDALAGFSYIYDQDGNGEIDGDEAELRSLANQVYTDINEGGDI